MSRNNIFHFAGNTHSLIMDMWYRHLVRISTFLLCSIMPHYVLAQSLESGLNLTTNYEQDTASVNNFLNKADSFLNMESDSANILFLMALEKSKQLHYTYGITQSLFALGLEKQEKGQLKESIAFFQQAYPYCNNVQLLASYYTNMATSIYHTGNYADAAYHYYKALQFAVNPRLLMVIYNDLSGIWGTFSNPEIAYFYLKNAEFIALRSKLNSYLPMIYNNIGVVLQGEKKNDLAYNYYLTAFTLAKKYNNTEIEQRACTNIANTLIEKGQNKRALLYLESVINSKEIINPYSSIVYPHYLLGKVYYQLKDYSTAERHLKYSLQTANRYEIKNVINTHGLLVEIYKNKHAYKKALEHFEQNVSIYDSIMGVGEREKINELELKYKLSEKNKKILQNQILIAHKNIWILVTSLSALLLGLGTMVFYFLYKNNVAKRKLQEEKIKLLHKNRELDILKATMHGEEIERARIGRDLHDGVGGLLSVVKMKVSTLNNNEDKEKYLEEHTNTITLIDESIKELRQTAHNLMPEALLKYGLVEAVRVFSSKINNGNSIIVQVYTFGEIPKLDFQFSLSLYRIVQELLNNVIKHANAHVVSIHFNWLEDSFVIIVEDDGVGLKIDKINYQDSFGLTNILSRIDALYGTINIDGCTQNGTVIHIEFLLENLKNVLT